MKKRDKIRLGEEGEEEGFKGENGRRGGRTGASCHCVSHSAVKAAHLPSGLAVLADSLEMRLPGGANSANPAILLLA